MKYSCRGRENGALLLTEGELEHVALDLKPGKLAVLPSGGSPVGRAGGAGWPLAPRRDSPLYGVTETGPERVLPAGGQNLER